MRKKKPNLESLIIESNKRDKLKVEQGTHKWVYDQKTKSNTLVKC